MSYFESFQKLIDTRDWKEQARLFDEYTKSELQDPQEAIDILRLFKEHKLESHVGTWIDKGLRFLSQISDEEKSYEITKLVLDLQTSQSKELADLALSTLSARFGSDTLFADKIRLIGLRECQEFQGAISNYELLSHLEKGAFVFHGGGWGTGEVMEISPIREELLVEFENVTGNKTLSFKNAFTQLIPLSKEHFLARRFGDPDRLEEFAKKDSVGVLRLFLKDLGPHSAAEIKEEFLDLVIPEDEWSKWWQGARAKMKKDKLIFVPEELSEKFFLRDHEVSHEERFYKALDKKGSARDLINLIYSFVRDFPETLKQEEFRSDIETKLEELAQDQALNLGEKVEVTFLLQDIGKKAAGNVPEECYSSTDAAINVLEEIEVLALKKRFLVEVQKSASEFKGVFIDLLAQIPQLQLKDYLLAELVKVGAQKELEDCMRTLLTSPDKSPTTVVWYFQKIIQSSDLPLATSAGKRLFFEAMLVLLSYAEGHAQLRELVKKIYHLMTDGRYQLVRDIFAGASLQETKELLLVASKCQSFTEHDRKILQSLAEVVHPSLGSGQASEVDGDEIVWTTAQGHQMLKDKIQQIGTVDMVENAREIEEARSHGDLRENSEFKFALEKRDRLQADLKMLSNQFNSMRILTAQDVDTKKVSVGCQVEIEVDGKGKDVFTILGPMEADPEKHILSFKSQLAQQMLGKQVGESFDFKGQKAKVKAIHNYFTKTHA